MGTTVEHDDSQTVHNNRTIQVDGTHTETIVKDTTIKITEGNLDHDVVTGNTKHHVKGTVEETYDNTQTTTVIGAVKETYLNTQTTVVTNDIQVSSMAATVVVYAATSITLVTGASKIFMEANGHISIEGTKIEITGSEKIEVSAPKITSSATGLHEISGALIKLN
jgi:type VI secretion system secreted protein VgrG